MIKDYNEIIEALNSHSINLVKFRVKDYAHYRNCKITVKKDELLNGNVIYWIDVNLSDDGSERVGFYDTFKEGFKLFRIGRKGSFTLKQLWDIIEIVEIN